MIDDQVLPWPGFKDHTSRVQVERELLNSNSPGKIVLGLEKGKV